MRKTLLLLVIAVLSLSGCGTNPVTGKTELQFIGESQEIAMGQQNYLPARQMQGGDYVLDPELTRYVSDIGMRIASVSARPELPYEFVVLNNSVPNAWAMPGGKVAINRGLLMEMNSEAELAAVIGHEIVHAAARHGAKNIERAQILQVGLIGLQISQRDNEYGNYVVGAGAIAAQLVSQKYGRNAELESDLYGMRYMKAAGYDPTAAVDLQQTFVRLSEGRRSDWLSGLFASHPPSQARVERNRATLAAVGAGGEYGRERYQQFLARLKKTAPAYEAYDDGVKALAEGNYDTARTLARSALDIEPREAKFYGLYGDSLLKAKDYRGALGYYSQAIERNRQYFQPYLTSGIAYRQLDDLESARQNFEKSIEFLPTATAYHGLGMIALAQGRRAEAEAYLEKAASSNTAVGRDAAVTLVKMKPTAYVRSGVDANEQGDVLGLVRNDSPVTIYDITVEIRVFDASGQRLQSRKTQKLGGRLEPGKVRGFDTGLGPIEDTSQLRRVNVVVLDAKVAE